MVRTARLTRMVTLLFLLVFSVPPSSCDQPAWRCPQISEKSSELSLSCQCEISHTLRCDGVSAGPAQLSHLVQEVASLPPEQRVSLLDISVRNISRLHSKLFQSSQLRLSGLVVSTGSLRTVDRKAFTGLERSLAALGLPDNNLTKVPVTSLNGLQLLSRLDLSGNLVGKVTTLPRLAELEYLDLSRNKISLLAAGWAQSTPSLRTLLLAWNQLDMKSLIQGDLQHLTYLQQLDLSHNKIAGQVSQALVGSVCPAGVKTLDMSFNGLTGITSLALSRLSSLTALNLAANRIDLVQDSAFSGLASLTSLDLSHNNILTLSTNSLAGLTSLSSLSLGHNYLQVVSSSWLSSLTNLTHLLVMDNDIITVEDGALDSLTLLTEINLAGNLLSCDCGVSYLYSYLHSASSLTSLSLHSAVCATPPALTNAPLYQLSSSPQCDPTTSDIPGDFYYTYEYYSENTTEQNMANLLSSHELHFLEASYDSTTQELHLTWQLEENGLTFTCGQLHVFEERETEGVVNLSNEVAECDIKPNGEVSLTVLLGSSASPVLQSDRPYIFCLSLHHGDLLVPGCSGPVTADQVGSHPQPEVRITSLQGNISLTHNITVTVSTRVPATRLSSCSVTVTVALPGHPPISVENYGCGDSGEDSSQLEAVMSNIPAHSYYNVCALLSIHQVQADRQCMILHTSTIVRYQTRSVLSLLLTLIFLSLGIACLTVLYLIIRHRAGPRTRPSKHLSLCPGLGQSFGYWWRAVSTASYNNNKLVEDFSDDEEI